MTEEEKFALIPKEHLPLAMMLQQFQLSELVGEPQTGKWYRLRAEHTICANGEDYHACFKVGTENALMILLYGGGVSVNAYTAAHPNSAIKMGMPSFYCEDVFLVADVGIVKGIASEREDNAFRNWSVLAVPYATGDFHCGTADFEYKTDDGEKRRLHHHGYCNLMALLDRMKQYVPAPDKLLITGFSAGGFGTALLTDDIVQAFPQCNDITCLVDSALMEYDWRNVAVNVWGTPVHIADRLHTRDITGDSLISLHDRHQNIKIGFICTVRDEALSQFQNFLDGGKLEGSTEAGDRFTGMLRNFVMRLQNEIPGISIFLHDLPAEGPFHLTAHCIIAGNAYFTQEQDGIKLTDWIGNLMNETAQSVGLGLLKTAADQ